MSATENVYERDSLNSACIPPASVNGTATSGSIDMSVFERAEFTVAWGANATPVTVNGALYAGNAANGSGKVALTGLASGGISNSQNSVNGQMTMEVRSDQIVPYRYLFLVLTTSGPLIVSATCRGTVCRFKPANKFDDASVTQRYAG